MVSITSSPFHLSLYDIIASLYASIVESCCHPILLDDISNITSCHITTGNHIMPHHYGDHSS
jgi:hypothetical protein